MSVRALLDDAAAEATAGLRIDVRAAYVRSNERRARARWRAGAMMASGLVVAAVLALVAVTLPATGWLHRSSAVVPGNGRAPVGLPDRWYGLNSWAPSLKRAHMPAASMVLVGAGWPMLVSADGTRYAHLPWSSGDQQVTLSADGRYVAWISPAGPAGKRGLVIHRLRLPDAHDHRTALPAGPGQQTVRQVIWAGHSLYVVSGGTAAGSAFHTWRLDGTTGAPVSVCACGRFPLGVDGTGHLRQPAVLPGRGSTATPELPGVALTPGSGQATRVPDDPDASFEAPQMVVAPDGERSASVISSLAAPGRSGAVPRFELAVTGGPAPDGATGSGASSPVTRRFPVTGTDQITDVHLLGWSPAGLIVRVKSLKNTGLDRDNVSIRLMAPDGSGYRVISRAAWRGYEPVAVASDVVGTGATVPAREPHFSTTDRAHLAFLFRYAWSLFGSRATAALLVVLGLGTALIARRRRRRRSGLTGDGEAAGSALVAGGTSGIEEVDIKGRADGHG